MGFVMETCSYCGRVMPKHTLVMHLKKRHSKGVPVNQGKTGLVSLADDYFGVGGRKWYERWDAGEIRVCAQCKTEWPDKLMAFHLRDRHGL